MTEDKQRTLQQNRALHKLFELVAESLNTSGLEMRTVLQQSPSVPWRKETVKELIWRPLQEALVQKYSTVDLNRAEVNEVYETFNRFLGEMGVSEPFPSVEQIIEAYEQYK